MRSVKYGGAKTKLLFVVLVLALSASPALGAAPNVAWSLRSVAQPTSFSSSDPEQEIVEVVVDATSGTFTLTTEGDTTTPIAYNATPSEIQTALDALASIGGVGGTVTVTGGPGDEGATHPYFVSIGGALAGKNFAGFEGRSVSLAGGSGTVETPTFTGGEGHFVDQYALVLTNVGGVTSEGPVTLTDTLPEGVTTSETPTQRGGWECTPGAGNTVVICTSTSPAPALTPAGQIIVHVQLAPNATGNLVNRVEVAGGLPECGEFGHPSCPVASASSSTSLDSPMSALSALNFGASVLDASGMLDAQAGDHPSALTTAFDLPTASGVTSGAIEAQPVEDLKQIIVDLPAGIVGDAQAAPACTPTVLSNESCPPATRVGTLALFLPRGLPGAGVNPRLSIYNVVPEQGHPAEFGIYEPVLARSALMYASLRSGSDYGVRVSTQNLQEAIPTEGISATFFGNPAVRDESGNTPMAMFTNSSNCGAPSFTTSIHVDSWQHPGRTNADGEPDFNDPNWKLASSQSPAVSGCEALRFSPTIDAQPSTTQADSPAGLNFDLDVPQESDPNNLATPPLKDVTVALPAGLAISPSSADGLEACSDAQIALSSGGLATCPAGSQIGTVSLRTPLLAGPLEGQVFLGAPECGPCTVGNNDPQEGRMVRLFVQVHSEQYGVTIKLAGKVSVDPVTGQLTATFKNNPQQPFDELKLQLKSGPRAPLATPSACGVYTTRSDLTPWSSPLTVDATPSSSFAIAGCANPSQFAPSFAAGTVNPQAGGFSPFTLTLSRQDSDQQLSGLTATLPPGLLARLAGVPLCSGSDANAGTCPAASQIGSVTAGAGPGSHPFFLPGHVYLTGPYNGGPFGLVVEVPAIAGPFNLGTVVVRQSLRVDSHTAQATVVSNPLPTILDGIPLQVRTVSVTVDREGFMFNPTNCEPLTIGGVLTSVQGTQAQLSSRFQAENCAALGFAPKFTVSTQAKTSKKSGASLDVKVGYPSGAQANIGSVAVTLPKQLPSRLTTIQQACPQATFNANPASCPAGSSIGIATAHTPVLAGPVSGPAYLVSHGGAAFPDLVVILQGEGVTLDLVGSIDIKKGVTSSTFASIPDAPISSFELNLPEGPHSGLAAVLPAKAKGSLCGTSLIMPTTLTGQNGAVLKQNTKIAVTDCAKVRKKAKVKKHTKRARGSKGRNTQRAQGK